MIITTYYKVVEINDPLLINVSYSAFIKVV